MEIDRRSSRRLAVAAFLVVALLTTTAAIAAGAPSTFGHRGRVLVAFGDDYARGAAIVPHRGGGMVVAGTLRGGIGTRSGRDDGEDLVLVRFRPDGGLDPSFGRRGVVRTDLGANEAARDATVDRFGRIVVAGLSANRSHPWRQEALVVRYTAKGSLDASFGEGGVVRAGGDPVAGVAVDAAGRILFAGAATVGAAADAHRVWRVVRLRGDGGIDPEFGGGDGEVTGVLGIGAEATDLTVDRRGRVAFPLCAWEGPARRLPAVARLLPDGSPDPTFGEGGMAALPSGAGWNCPYAVARDHRDRLVVGGNGDHRLVVTRLGEAGSPDPAFGDDGTASLGFRGAKVRIGRIALDGEGRVVLAGRIAPSMKQLVRGPRYAARMLLVRLTKRGGRDRRLGDDGAVAIRFGPGRTFDSQATDVMVRGDLVFAAGTAAPHLGSSPPARLALVRYPAGGRAG
jgi:uncharacterized delta-60 repeat protein